MDKFHVLKMANAALDQMRKSVGAAMTARQRRTLMKDRKLLLMRPKDQGMEATLDYDRAAYADRRRIELRSEIVVPAAVRERASEHGMDRADERPARKRGMFDGLKLNTGRVMPPEAQRDAFAGVREPARERVPEMPQREAPDLTRAVDRYARAWTDGAKMRVQDLPILEHQKVALRDAGAALDAVRPGATRDLLTALEHEPATHQAMTAMRGRERATQPVAGIEHEARVRQDPNLKAERLVKVWNGLEAQREGPRGWDQAEARGKVEARMKSIAGALKRDPQLESLMRNRQRELGIAPGSALDRVMRERNIERAIGHSLGRGLGMSR